MELIQINWDENENLFLKFGKNEEEKRSILPENVKYINLQYNISRVNDNHYSSKSLPVLTSIKNPYYSENEIGLAIELDEIYNYNDLQIELMNLTIIFNSGKRNQLNIREKFPLSEIFINDACYLGFVNNSLKNKVNTEITIKEEKSITIKTSKPNYNKFSEDSEIPGESISITISREEYNEWRKIKGNKSWSSIMYIIREAFNRLNNVDQELKEANAALREIALKNADHPLYSPPPLLNPPPKGQNDSSEPIRGPPKRKLAANPLSKPLLLPNKDPHNLDIHTAVIREMKEKFQKISNVKEILTEVPEEILYREIPRTDHISYIKFKEIKVKEIKN